MYRMFDFAIAIGFIVVIGILIIELFQKPKNIELKQYSQQLEQEKLELEIKRLQYEIKLLEEQGIPVDVE